MPSTAFEAGGGVERLREGVGEVDDAVLLGHRAHGRRAVVDVGADDIVDAFLRHLLHAGDGALGVLLVVEGDDLDVVGLVADLDAARLVEPGGERLHGAHVRGAPGGRRAAGDADEADLELVGVLGQRRAAQADDGGGRGREGDGFQKVASLHRILSPDRCHSRLSPQGDEVRARIVNNSFAADVRSAGVQAGGKSAIAHGFGMDRSVARNDAARHGRWQGRPDSGRRGRDRPPHP